MTQKDIIEWIKKEFPQKAEYIIKHRLSEKKILAAGIKLKPQEIFVQWPGWPKLYGSNYGRAITYSNYRGEGLHLRKEPKSEDGHVYYSFSKPKVTDKNGRVVRAAQHIRIPAHRMVALLFLPNYWPTLRGKQIHSHHLFGVAKDDNDWRNLVLCPIWIHFYCLEPMESMELWQDGQWTEYKPYEMMEQTGLTLDEICLPLRREPDSKMMEDGRQWDIYAVGNFTIRYKLIDPDFRLELKKKGKKVASWTWGKDYE